MLKVMPNWVVFFFLSRNQSFTRIEKLDSTEADLVDFVDPVELESTGQFSCSAHLTSPSFLFT